MGGLLELFGKAITVDTSDLIWHWLDERREVGGESPCLRDRHLGRIVELMGEGRGEAAGLRRLGVRA